MPNVLTVLRILLVPVLVAALLSEGPQGDLLAAIVFAFASFTDALDGWIARRAKIESTFGKLMDPLADKLLVTSALVSLVSLDRLSAWVAMVIIARELAVTGLRQIAIEQGHVIAASLWGKLKTRRADRDGDVPDRRRRLARCWVDGVVYVTVAITVLSGRGLLLRPAPAAALTRPPSSQSRSETWRAECSPEASSCRSSPSRP